MKDERGLRVGEKLAPLGALEIGEEDESPGVVVLEENHADIGQAVAVDGRQRHGIGIVQFGGFRLGKPLREK